MLNSIRYLFIIFLILFLLGCGEEKSPKEKLEEKIEKSPEFKAGLIKSINQSIQSSIPQRIELANVPDSFNKFYSNSIISEFIVADLTYDAQHDAILILDSIDYSRLSIMTSLYGGGFKVNKSVWDKNIRTSEIKIKNGIVTWLYSYSNLRHEKKIKYINNTYRILKQNSYVESYENGVKYKLEIELNYLSKEKKVRLERINLEEGTSMVEEIEQDEIQLIQMYTLEDAESIEDDLNDVYDKIKIHPKIKMLPKLLGSINSL